MKIGSIGHIDHEKTALTEAILRLREIGNDVIIIDEKERGMTINESIKLDNSLMLNSLRESEVIQETFKSGRESRRERRKQERKNK